MKTNHAPFVTRLMVALLILSLIGLAYPQGGMPSVDSSQKPISSQKKWEKPAWLVGKHAFLEGYFRGVSALVDEDFRGASEAFKMFQSAIQSNKPPYLEAWKNNADKLASAKNVSEQRSGLRETSATLMKYAVEYKLSEENVTFYRCTMQNELSVWASPVPAVNNPYSRVNGMNCEVKLERARVNRARQFFWEFVK